jgi:hypothetical protein
VKKKYDISKKSDMRRFSRDLEKSITGQINNAINNGFEIDCPSCDRSIKVTPGLNQCVYCKKEIDFNVKA